MRPAKGAVKGKPQDRLRLATDERRGQLLDLGKRLFNERPYDEISIDDIAAEAKISKGLLYHYFPSKKDFYVATVRAAAEEMVKRTRPPDDLLPSEKLERGLDAYLDFVELHAGAYRALMRSGASVDESIADIVEETRGTFARRLAEEGLNLREPRPVVRIALRAWIGFVEAASLDWLEKRDVERPVLRAMLGAALTSALLSAATLDPKSGLGG
ncbi:MAG: TetR/AcrR family transcriptional regulator [Polyangiales bacterium]